jgi:hypothetical protein
MSRKPAKDYAGGHSTKGGRNRPPFVLSPLRPITQQHSTADAAKTSARWNTILRGAMIACGHERGGGGAQQA